MQFKMRLCLFMLPLVLIAALSAGCSKDDAGNGNTYPKTVSVEYKLIPTAGITNASTIVYTNETGGNSSLSNTALPFSAKFSRSVNRSTGIAVGVTASGNGSIRCEIIVDGKVIVSETYTGNSVITGSSAYVFP
jgi:Mycobacterium membrane protein